MAWLEITVGTAPACIDRVAAMLTCGGFAELSIEDGQSFRDFLEENRAYWDYIDDALEQKLKGASCIRLYLEEGDASSMEKLDALLEALRRQGLGELPKAVRKLPEQDWNESWKENYPPVPLGSRLIVLPYWLENPAPERIPVILDPGLTFGTGNHPTTQMVLRQMEKYVTPGCHCLDLGSGSGILSLAALRLGAGKAVGVDIDEKAEGIARENAAYNGFGAPEFTAYTGSVTEDKALMATLRETSWDVVLVNIVADVIVALCPVLPDFLGKGTHLILSGILDTRLNDVLEALRRAGLTVCEMTAQEEWRCICAGKEEA